MYFIWYGPDGKIFEIIIDKYGFMFKDMSTNINLLGVFDYKLNNISWLCKLLFHKNMIEMQILNFEAVLYHFVLVQF